MLARSALAPRPALPARALTIVLPLLLLPVASCKRPPAAAQVVVPDAAPAVAPISAAPIEVLISKWQAAQNAGDFESYQALYADPFSGLRRSGTRVHVFDRAGWMKDRQRMFRKPQRVSVTAIEIGATSPEQATVRFTQQWSSGAYRDQGKKELSLRATAAGLRIAREELLASEVLFSEADGKFIHLVDESVVLVKGAPESWGEGEPQASPIAAKRDRGGEVEFGHNVETTYKRLLVDRLPERLRSWTGRRLRLFGLPGQLCEATVGEMALASALDWDRVDESLQVFGPEEHPSDRRLRKGMWRQGKKLLLGKLTAKSGKCADALFARAAELPVPKIVPFEEAKPPWEDVGLRLFHAHPLYKKIAAAWQEYHQERSPPERTAWDEADGGFSQRSILFARNPLRDGYLLSIKAHRATDMDKVFGVMWLIAAVSGTPKSPVTTALNQPTESNSITPIATLDIDGDGRLEFLSRVGLLSAPAEHPLAYSQTDYLDLPYYNWCDESYANGDDEIGGLR
jgi:ketosteroid isomerase-like protein